MVAIRLCVQFELYQVVIPLGFLHSNQPCFIVNFHDFFHITFLSIPKTNAHGIKGMYLFGDVAAILNSTVSNGYDYYGKRETARDRIHDKHCQRRIIRRFMCVGLWAGVTYLRYTVLMSPNKRS